MTTENSNAPQPATKAETRLEDPVKLKLIQELNQALRACDTQEAVFCTGELARYQGMGEVAGKTGLNRAQLYRTLGVRGNPAFVSIMKILDSMGLTITVMPKV